MNFPDLLKHMGPSSLKIAELHDPFLGKNTRQRAVQPCLTVVGIEDFRKVLGPIVCECGAIAQTVARSPEVLTDLLCDCLRPPGGEALGMPKDLRFPDEYHQMGVSLEQCQSLMAARRAKSGQKVTKREEVILRRPELFDDGISTGRLGRELSMSSLFDATRRLESRGYIERIATQPFKPWKLTEAGRAAAAELIG